MFGFTRKEMRFTLVISATHLTQHFLMRLIPPLIPVLAVALEYPLWKLGLLISAFSLGSGLGQAPIGVLSDKYDRLYILPPGIAIAGGSYVLFAASPLVGTIIPPITLFGNTFEGFFILMCAAMLICGIGTAVVHPVGYPMITDNVTEANKGKALGAFGSSSKLGDSIAPAVVAVAILALAWHQILLVLGGVGITFGIILFLVLRAGEFETTPAGRVNTENDPDEDRAIRDGDKRTYVYPLIVIYLFFITKKFASDGVKTFLPVFLVGVYTYSFQIRDVNFSAESTANFYFSALLVSAAVTQLGLGGLTDRYDSRTVLLSCVGVATAGLLSLAVLDLGPVLLLLILLLLGAGIWGLNPARDALISEITPAEREGRTFGYIWTAVHLAGSLMPVIVGYIMDIFGMRQAFVMLAVGTALSGALISLLFLNRVYVPGSDSSVRAESLD